MERKEVTKEEDVKIDKVERQKDLRSYKKVNENAREVLEQVKKLYASQNESFHFTSIYGTYIINGEEFNRAYDYVGENGEKVSGRSIIQDIIKEVLGIDYNLFSKINNVGVLIKEGKINQEIIDEFSKFGLCANLGISHHVYTRVTPEKNKEIVKDFIADMNKLIQHNGENGFLFKTFIGPVIINNVQYRYSRNVKYKYNGKENVSGEKIIDDYLKEQFEFKHNLGLYLRIIQRMKNEGKMTDELYNEIEEIHKKLNDRVDKIKQEKQEEIRKSFKKERGYISQFRYDPNGYAKSVLADIESLYEYKSRNENFSFTSIFGTYTINGVKFGVTYGWNTIQDIIKENLGINYLLNRVRRVGVLIKERKINQEIIDKFNEYGIFVNNKNVIMRSYEVTKQHERFLGK